MSNIPKIIALSCAANYTHTSNKIYVQCDTYNKNCYLIDYGDNSTIIDLDNRVSLDDQRHFNFNFNNLDDFDENIILFIKTFIKKYGYNCDSNINVTDVLLNDDSIHYIMWNNCAINKLFLIIYSDSGSIAIVSNDEVITTIYDEETNYQSGDGDCDLVELDNGDILIINDGDVRSFILFTINLPNFYVYETNDHSKNFDFNDSDSDDYQTIESIKYLKKRHWRYRCNAFSESPVRSL